MLHLPRRETKLMVAIHGWSGVVLGLLLYAVVATGTAAVLAHEIGVWSAGVTEGRSALARPVDALVRDLAARTSLRFHEGIDLFETTDRELGVFFHRHEAGDGPPVERGTYYEVTGDGRITRTVSGTGEQVFGPNNDSALARFLVDTHVRLHLPDPWGLLLTGVVGLAMLVAAVSGLLIHRHLLEDAFTLRTGARPVLAARDRHSVAGTWSLPFAFIVAFTGSFFSFAGSIGLPTVAAVAFAGDQSKMFETLVGVEPAADPRPARPGNLDRVLADATSRAGAVPDFISIGHYGRVDASVTTSHPPREGGLEPVTLVFDGATAGFKRIKPIVGTTSSFGGALFSVIGPLHFGNFAGLLSKAVWVALGFAACFVTITGMRLWLSRREGLGVLACATTVITFGLPLSLAGAGWGSLLGMSAGEAVAWTPRAFILAAALVIAAGFAIRDNERLGRLLRLAAGAAILVLPFIRLGVGGPGWGEALAAGAPLIPGIDVVLLLAGTALLRPMLSLRTRRAPMASPSRAAE